MVRRKFVLKSLPKSRIGVDVSETKKEFEKRDFKKFAKGVGKKSLKIGRKSLVVTGKSIPKKLSNKRILRKGKRATIVIKSGADASPFFS